MISSDSRRRRSECLSDPGVSDFRTARGAQSHASDREQRCGRFGTRRGVQSFAHRSQRGFSLIGFLCTLLVFVAGGWLALRMVPGMLEYWAIEKAIVAASAVAATPDDVRKTFDKLAAAGSIDAIAGKDLQISGRGKDMKVSFAYEQRIRLTGPASLLIEYKGSTARDVPEKAAN